MGNRLEDSLEPLLPRVANGDADAVKACIERYGGLIWSMARRFSPTIGDAEDAVQEAFIDIWRSAGRYRAHQGSERLFITVIARRRLIDRLRQQQRCPPTTSLDVDHPALPTDETNYGELCVDATRAAIALGQLDEQQRQALYLSVIYGYSHSEIATALALPLGTVKTHIRRGLLQVRLMLVNPRQTQAGGASS